MMFPKTLPTASSNNRLVQALPGNTRSVDDLLSLDTPGLI